LSSKIIDKGRYGGILLHPTSLPGKYGIGELGEETFRFIDFLYEHGQNLWQILPLGPTGYADSPYALFSAFAGNPLVINLEKLMNLNLLKASDLEPNISFPDSYVDFGKVIPFKYHLLEKAFDSFYKKQYRTLKTKFDKFKMHHKFWLEDYTLYMSIKKEFEFEPWNTWDLPLRIRDHSTISSWKKKYSKDIEFHRFIQFLFFQQWNEVKTYANKKNIRIIGDIPIFVAYDSADVWSHPEYYYLDDQRELVYVAGVPPDYFSKTGQRWGNPLYRWDVMKSNHYKWWVRRIQHNFKIVDILRIDHFRGFESYWRINANEPTAVKGKWIAGPGIDLFIEIKKILGHLPIIAEDLGIITPEVKDILHQTGYPGMRVLQFAFGDESEDYIDNQYLPHNFEKNTVIYTGTHDNDTTKSWFDKSSLIIQKQVLDYLNSNGKDIVGDLIRLAWSSVAQFCIIPFQDLLRLGTEGRMNVPGTVGNNWTWRFKWDPLIEERGKEIFRLSKIYGRRGKAD
jgi:4-alpha-glucanotransferase